MNKENCIFCKIANDEIPSFTIYEDEEVRVFLDISPASKGHALVIPKKHFENIYDLDEATASKVFVIVSKIAKVLKTSLNCDGLNIIQNNEKLAGQTVFHFHMHLIPRYKGDTVSISWKNTKTKEEEMIFIRNLLSKEL